MPQFHEFCEVTDYGYLMTKKTDWIQNLSFSLNKKSYLIYIYTR